MKKMFAQFMSLLMPPATFVASDFLPLHFFCNTPDPDPDPDPTCPILPERSVPVLDIRQSLDHVFISNSSLVDMFLGSICGRI